MNPSSWGPQFWFVIHIGAINAISQPARDAYVSWITTLPQILPCADCRNHFAQLLSNPVYDIRRYKNAREDLVYWTWIAHNLVNQRLRKRIMTEDEFVDRYRGFIDASNMVQSNAPQNEMFCESCAIKK